MSVTKSRAVLLGLGSLVLLSIACGPASQPSAGRAAPLTISSSQTGNDGGYYFSFWTNGQGSCTMNLDGSNGYSVNWSNVGDFTAGKGWNPGSNHTICYTGTYSNSGGGGLGIYGWTKNPLVEYYIVDSPGDSGSPGQGQQMGTVTSDGGTYTIWKHQQVNQPCITGNSCTFWQYISVRNAHRVGGTITIKNHFDAWAAQGMNLGSHDYQILLTESWNGSGSSSVKVSTTGCDASGGGGGGGTVGGGGGGSPTGPGTPISIAAGATSGTGSFVADNYFSGGSTYTNTASVTAPSGVPAAIFNSERYGTFTYTLSGYPPSSAWNVTLYFAETYLTAAGQRSFDVALNGSKVLSAYDIFADAGGANIGVGKTFNVTASNSGQIVIDFQPGSADSPKVNGIVVVAGSAGGGGGGSGGGGGGAGGGGGGGGGADLTPPSAPSNLTWNAAGMTVILSWGASTDDVGVAGYQLYYGSFYLGEFTDTSLALLGFRNGTPYNFTVRAVDAAGNVSQASNQTTVLLQQTGTDSTPPTAPSNLVATNVGSTAVSLRWSASSDDVGVVVYQLYAGAAVVGTVPASTSGTVSGLQPGTTYSFTVRASDAAGNTSDASNAVTVTTLQGGDTTPPSAPTGLSASNLTSSALTLSWAASTDDVGVTTYDVYNGSVLVGTTSGTSLSISGLAAATTYGLTVKARDAAGNVSASSSTLSVTTIGAGGGGGDAAGSPIWIDAGGSATGSFVADADFSGGSTYTNTATVSSPSSLVPAEVFQSERYGAFTYTIPGYGPGATWTVTLYFAETYLTAAGQRSFDVSINGTKVLSGFDIYAAAGGSNIGVAKSFSVPADGSGQFVIAFAAGSAENPKVNGISVTKDPISLGGGGGGGVGGGGGGIQGGGGGGITYDSGLPAPPTTGVARPSGSVGGLRVVDWAGFKGAITYTFDDSQPSQIEHYSELQAAKVPMTFYACQGTSGDVSNYVSTWKQAVKDGHEIGNHTAHHCYSGLTGCSFGSASGSAINEIDSNASYITQTFGNGAVYTMASPFGDTGWDSYAQQRYFINRGVGSGMIGPNDNSDPFNLPCHMAATGESTSSFNSAIDSARGGDKWLIFLVHTISPTSNSWYNPIDISTVTGSISHAKSTGDLWIDTMVNVGAYWRAQKAISSVSPTTSGNTLTYAWTLPAHFPPNKYVRVTVTGGTLMQGGKAIAWDTHGYYEVSLDAGALTLSP